MTEQEERQGNKCYVKFQPN